MTNGRVPPALSESRSAPRTAVVEPSRPDQVVAVSSVSTSTPRPIRTSRR